MKDWYSEEEIKAQLRDLTTETRKLRSELHALIRPSKTLPTSAFVHDRGNPKTRRDAKTEKPPSRRRK